MRIGCASRSWPRVAIEKDGRVVTRQNNLGQAATTRWQESLSAARGQVISGKRRAGRLF